MASGGSRRGNKWIGKPSFRTEALKKVFGQELKVGSIPDITEKKAEGPSISPATTINDANKLVESQDVEAKKELYDCDNSLTIRGMLAMGGFNAIFWTHYLLTALLFKGESDAIVQGQAISLAGDPIWGYIGVVGTGVILYSTHKFAMHSVRRAYLTADKQRIGFQMNNILGNAGKTMEVRLGLAKVIENTGPFASSYIPIKIDGASLNIILDDKGNFQNEKELLVLLEKYKDGYVQPKEDRIVKLHKQQNQAKHSRK